MSDHDLLLETIDAIYASGVDREKLPAALELTSRLFEAAGATYEIVDIPNLRHTDFWSVGAPSDVESRYVEEFAATNSLPFASNQHKGQIIWTYQQHDENQIARHPFYNDFMSPIGLRYCIGAVIERTEEQLVVVYAQRTIKQGHVDRREIALMEQLCPHFQRAHDMASRLQINGNRQGAFEDALEWMVDGVALLRADGSIAYANEALCNLARICDAFRIAGDMIEFASPHTRQRFGAAFSAIEQAHRGLSFNTYPADFPVLRKDGVPAYMVAMRPLGRGQTQYDDAAVMLLIHDPLTRNIAARQMLQELFGLTEAEAHLGQALCAGMTTGAYASTRRVSLNTVYTHLRKIREKTGCKSVAELVRRFGELNMPLRPNRTLPSAPFVASAPVSLLSEDAAL